MKRVPIYWFRAKRILSKRDKVLKKIIKKYKKGFLTTRNNPFFSLCRTIVGQQISTKAADSIWSKFEKKCKKNITPKVVLKLIKTTRIMLAPPTLLMAKLKVPWLQNKLKNKKLSNK